MPNPLIGVGQHLITRGGEKHEEDQHAEGGEQGDSSSPMWLVVVHSCVLLRVGKEGSERIERHAAPRGFGKRQEIHFVREGGVSVPRTPRVDHPAVAIEQSVKGQPVAWLVMVFFLIG